MKRCLYCNNQTEENNKICENCKNKITSVLSTRHITKIVHFTPLENLPYIGVYGLRSRDWLEQNRIPVRISNNDRYDHHTDCLSCSIEHPNYRMRYKIVCNSDVRHAVLEIDPKILLDEKCFCSFTNAARESGSLIMDITHLNTLLLGEREFGLEEKYPTDTQAEILIFNHIDLQYIKYVVFENKLDFDEYQSKIPATIKVRVDGKLFRRR